MWSASVAVQSPGSVPDAQICSIWAHDISTVLVYYHLATLIPGCCKTEHHDGRARKRMKLLISWWPHERRRN